MPHFRRSGKMYVKKYPKCSKLGVLRETNRFAVVVSTTALCKALGWERYRRYLPVMRHRHGSGPTPESCETFLSSLGKS